MTLNFKKVRENAKVPTRGTEGSAGMDMYACIEQEVTINPGELKIIPTGIAVAVPSADYAVFLYARSGLGVKYGICLGNGVGVIDSDYRGEICAGLCNVSDKPYTIQPQERICQMVVAPVVMAQLNLVEELDDTDRGQGKFGSTGKN